MAFLSTNKQTNKWLPYGLQAFTVIQHIARSEPRDLQTDFFWNQLHRGQLNEFYTHLVRIMNLVNPIGLIFNCILYISPTILHIFGTRYIK